MPSRGLRDPPEARLLLFKFLLGVVPAGGYDSRVGRERSAPQRGRSVRVA